MIHSSDILATNNSSSDFLSAYYVLSMVLRTYRVWFSFPDNHVEEKNLIPHHASNDNTT